MIYLRIDKVYAIIETFHHVLTFTFSGLADGIAFF